MKTRRIPSDEQKQKAAERREKFGALCKQLAEMPDAERIKLCASVGAVLTCEGRQLSDINTALLVMQYGGRVSVVGGFRQWKKAGRYVMKGQHGASIWIPKSRGEAPVDEGKREGEISGRELAAASEGRRFFLGTVFDISQTAECGAEGAEDSDESGAVESCEVVEREAVSVPALRLLPAPRVECELVLEGGRE